MWVGNSLNYKAQVNVVCSKVGSLHPHEKEKTPGNGEGYCYVTQLNPEECVFTRQTCVAILRLNL